MTFHIGKSSLLKRNCFPWNNLKGVPNSGRIDLPSEENLTDSEKEGMLIIPYNYDCNGRCERVTQVSDFT